MSLAPAVMACAFFLLFILCSFIGKVGRSSHPNLQFAKLHCAIGGVFLVFSITAGPNLFSDTHVGDWLVGLFIYVAFYHVVFACFLAMATRSISGAMLVFILERKGSAPRETCVTAFEKEKGSDPIIADRLYWANRLGFVEDRLEGYRLTNRGYWFHKITRFVRGLWGLKQLGT